MRRKPNNRSRKGVQENSFSKRLYYKFSDRLTLTRIAWFLLVAMFLSIVAIAVLHFTHYRTQIHAELVVDRVLFKAMDASHGGGIDMPSINAREVKLSNFDSIEFASMGLELIPLPKDERQNFTNTRQNFPCLDHLRIKPLSPDRTLTLDELRIPGGSKVALEIMPGLTPSLKLRIQSEGDAVKPYVSIPAHTEFEFAAIPRNYCDEKGKNIPNTSKEAVNGYIGIWGSKSKPIEITMSVDANELPRIFPNEGAGITDLKFYKNAIPTNSAGQKPESSLVGQGEITYPDLKKEKLSLQTSDLLVFGKSDDFRFENVELRPHSMMSNTVATTSELDSKLGHWALFVRFSGQAHEIFITRNGDTIKNNVLPNNLERLLRNFPASAEKSDV